MTVLMSVDERLAQIKSLQSRVTFTDDQEILDLPDNYIQEWEAGLTLVANSLVQYDGVKYLVLQAVTTIESQKPNDTGMLAIYKPYTDYTTKDWIYGEYVEAGWYRRYEGALYLAIQEPGANIYTPDQVAAIWELQPQEEI